MLTLTSKWFLAVQIVFTCSGLSICDFKCYPNSMEVSEILFVVLGVITLKHSTIVVTLSH